MRFSRGFGFVTRRERHRADRFYESLTGVNLTRRSASPFVETDEAGEQAAPAWTLPAAPYRPTGGRAFVSQAGVFNCGPATPFVVIPASFLAARTATPDAAIDVALTAAGLNPTQRGRITRDGLAPLATEFSGPALTELFARLRWSANDIARWGAGATSMLVPRLLIHIPGHFRELARRAPDAREAFVLECLGWLLMSHLRSAVASATGSSWWIPPAPEFVTAVPDPIPPMSAEVSRLFLRYLFIDTAMTAEDWNHNLVTWGTGLAGRQWQAEVTAPQPGRPFYASLATIPAHLNTGAARSTFTTAWNQRLADIDAAHPPHAAGATAVSLEGLRNAVALRECNNANPHLPAGTLTDLRLQGLELTYEFPRTRGATINKLALMVQLHPICTALFQAIRELGWNDLVYQTGGGGCFRGIKHPADARVQIGGAPVTVDPFNRPDATTVTRVNTNFNAAQRARVLRAARTARTLSEHGNGAAIEFNTQENEQATTLRPFGSIDPRIVAIFEAFHFRFGACFNPTDPMHFEYCQAPCAPAAAAAGIPGPVVTPRMLLPAGATATPSSVLA